MTPPPAQQEAQRAQFIVEKAKQERQEKVVNAEGEAEAAKMISSPPTTTTISPALVGDGGSSFLMFLLSVLVYVFTWMDKSFGAQCVHRRTGLYLLP